MNPSIRRPMFSRCSAHSGLRFTNDREGIQSMLTGRRDRYVCAWTYESAWVSKNP
ncbi:hypothetical protein J6590_005892 [Homalodisca vitripennis]|nr:hypothetical protein J6590_005892 [Homalodisca vitripennis]